MRNDAQHEQDQQYALERWKAVFGQYEAMKSAVERDVARWERTSRKRYDLRPLYFFRRTTIRGEILHQPPANLIGTWLYGSDRDERIIYEGVYLHPGKDTEDWFHSYSENVVEAVCFFPYEPHRPLPLEISHFYFEGERIARYVCLKLSGVQFPPPNDLNYSAEGVLAWLRKGSWPTLPHLVFIHENYFYEGNQLNRITIWSNIASRPREAYETEERIEYDPEASIRRIDAFADGKRYDVLYQRPQQTYEVIRQNAKEAMRETVKATLKNASLSQRVFSVVLYWTTNDPFDLVRRYSAVQYDHNRQELASQAKLSEIWHPRDLFVNIIMSPGDEDACQLFEQMITGSEDWYAVRDLLRDVAAELTRTMSEWTEGTLDVTDDFVVYVQEAQYEHDKLKESLLASVGEDQLKQWESAGYLPEGWDRAWS